MVDLADLLLLLPFAFAVLYAILGGIEFGLPLATFTSDHKARHRSKLYFPPAWESTNALLLAAIASAMALYPAAILALGPMVQTLWLIAGGLLGMRAVLVLLHFYGGWEQPELRWLLASVSLATPAVLIQTVTVLLTGESDLLNHAGIAIALAVLASVLPGALWGGYFYQPGQASRQTARMCYWLAILVANITLPMSLWLDGGVLDGRALTTVMWPVMAGSIGGMFMLMGARRRRYFWASATLVTGIAVALLLVQLPYLLRPVLTYHEAITSPASQGVITGIVVFGLLVTAPCLYVIRRLVDRRD